MRVRVLAGLVSAALVGPVLATQGALPAAGGHARAPQASARTLPAAASWEGVVAPVLATDPAAGRLLVVQRDRPGTVRGQVLATYRRPGATSWPRLSGVSAPGPTGPVVAADLGGEGVAAVAWTQVVDGARAVMLRERRGGAWRAARRISPAGVDGVGTFVDVVLNGHGDLAVLWQRHTRPVLSTRASGARWQRFAAGENGVGDPVARWSGRVAHLVWNTGSGLRLFKRSVAPGGRTHGPASFPGGIAGATFDYDVDSQGRRVLAVVQRGVGPGDCPDSVLAGRLVVYASGAGSPLLQAWQTREAHVESAPQVSAVDGRFRVSWAGGYEHGSPACGEATLWVRTRSGIPGSWGRTATMVQCEFCIHEAPYLSQSMAAGGASVLGARFPRARDAGLVRIPGRDLFALGESPVPDWELTGAPAVSVGARGPVIVAWTHGGRLTSRVTARFFSR